MFIQYKFINELISSGKLTQNPQTTLNETYTKIWKKIILPKETVPKLDSTYFLSANPSFYQNVLVYWSSINLKISHCSFYRNNFLQAIYFQNNTFIKLVLRKQKMQLQQRMKQRIH